MKLFASKTRADRIAEIRGGGSSTDGAWMLLDPLKISEDDYFLMGCDCSCTRRNFPNVPGHERMEGRWFAGADDLPQRCAGHNFHGSTPKDGRMRIDSFYTTLPRAAYRASPQEVEWHYNRVRELRAANVPQNERMATMTAEAKGKPWEKPDAS